jgi:hypothetical protein
MHIAKTAATRQQRPPTAFLRRSHLFCTATVVGWLCCFASGLPP